MTKPFITREQFRSAMDAIPHAVPIKADVFAFYQDIAKREGATVAAVINDQLRKMMGEA